MRLDFRGGTHLAQTLAQAAEIRGFTITAENPDLVFVAVDVEDHEQLGEVEALMAGARAGNYLGPIILASQVPPGYTRRWWPALRAGLYYQQDTIIMNRALDRALYPERFVVGAWDRAAPLHWDYAAYLKAFECPICVMSYESAELSKLAVNYLLAKQIEAANTLDAIAKKVGADWNEMVPGIRLDQRIGPKAYMRPGKPEGHLPRDLKTIAKLSQ